MVFLELSVLSNLELDQRVINKYNWVHGKVYGSVHDIDLIFKVIQFMVIYDIWLAISMLWGHELFCLKRVIM